MADPYLTSSAARKRKRPQASRATPRRARHPPQAKPVSDNDDDDEIVSEDDAGSDAESAYFSAEEEGEMDDETAAERRLRLAKEYLDTLRRDDEGEVDAEEIDRENIARRLVSDVAETRGKMYIFLASRLALDRATLRVLHWNKCVTGAAYHPPHVFSVGKDAILQKWDVQGEKTRRVRFAPRVARKSRDAGHWGAILDVAVSPDGAYVATCGTDGRIVVRNAETLQVERVFHHHSGVVYGLDFRRNTREMYSVSADRTVKIWNLDGMAYVQTLFGHQDDVVGVSSLAAERCVTVGARDKTARVWKIVEESQLVFRGGDSAKQGLVYAEGSLDTVACVDENHFVTGSDNGRVSLWSVFKKKPVFSRPLAHGTEALLPANRHSAELEPEPSNAPPAARWITAIATIPYSDLFVSGSWDGRLRFWRIEPSLKSFEPVGVWPKEQEEHSDKSGPLTGFVNSLQAYMASPESQTIRVVAAVGTEARCGRWMHQRNARNRVVVLEIPLE